MIVTVTKTHDVGKMPYDKSIYGTHLAGLLDAMTSAQAAGAPDDASVTTQQGRVTVTWQEER